MTTPEEKIRMLLALASHPDTPVEEARTAAHSAAKLMAEHKIQVGAPRLARPVIDLGDLGQLFMSLFRQAATRSPFPPPAPRPPRKPPGPEYQDFGPDFWARWFKDHPPPPGETQGTVRAAARRMAKQESRKRRRRSAQSRKQNPNRQRKRKT